MLKSMIKRKISLKFTTSVFNLSNCSQNCEQEIFLDVIIVSLVVTQIIEDALNVNVVNTVLKVALFSIHAPLCFCTYREYLPMFQLNWMHIRCLNHGGESGGGFISGKCEIQWHCHTTVQLLLWGINFTDMFTTKPYRKGILYYTIFFYFFFFQYKILH